MCSSWRARREGGARPIGGNNLNARSPLDRAIAHPRACPGCCAPISPRLSALALCKDTTRALSARARADSVPLSGAEKPLRSACAWSTSAAFHGGGDVKRLGRRRLCCLLCSLRRLTASGARSRSTGRSAGAPRAARAARSWSVGGGKSHKWAIFAHMCTNCHCELAVASVGKI